MSLRQRNFVPGSFGSALTLVIGAYLLAYLAWQIFGWGGDGHQALIGDLAIIPPTAFAAACCWAAARRHTDAGRLKWGWRFMALGIGGYVLGEVAQLLYEIANASYVFPSLADPLYLLFYPFVLAGMMCFSTGLNGSRSLRTALDAATLALGGAAVIWYLLLGPTATTDTGGLASTMASLAYPVGDLVLIVALARVLTEPGFAVRRPLELLAAGLLAFIVADVIYGRMVLDRTYTGGDPVDTFWILAMVAFAAAAMHPCRDGAEGEPGGGGRRLALSHGDLGFRREPGVVVLVPYLGTAMVFLLLIVSNRGDEFFPELSLVIVAATMAAFVTLRQVLAQRDLVQAHEKLHTAHLELAALASTDPLTGLANQRTLAAAIDEELALFRGHGRGGALVFLDIDHFKALNDTLGHAAGDAVLREFGSAVSSVLRSVDTFGRWGGEEFVVLLPQASEEEAQTVAERIRGAVAGHRFKSAVGAQVTVSAGLAFFPDDAETRLELLAVADEALYRAKRAGRDRVHRARCLRTAASGSLGT